MATCDPTNTSIYPQQTNLASYSEELEPYFLYFNAVFLVVFGPFLIITPFKVEKLATLGRKCIAMIVLADAFYAFTSMVQMLKQSDWENQSGFILSCAVCTFISNCCFLWSLLWSNGLLLVVLMSLCRRINTSKHTIFVKLNLIIWPLGTLATLSTYAGFQDFPITFNYNYIWSKSCQPELKFEIHGGDCLLTKQARAMIVPYYVFLCLCVIFAQILFTMIIRCAYKEWRRTTRLASLVETMPEETVGYTIAAQHSYSVLRNSVNFSVTGAIYAINYIPIIIKQLVNIYTGPHDDSEVLNFMLQLWFLCVGNFVSIMNIIFYGLCSKVLRAEMMRIFEAKLKRIEKCWHCFVETKLRGGRESVNCHSLDSSMTASAVHTDVE